MVGRFWSHGVGRACATAERFATRRALWAYHLIWLNVCLSELLSAAQALTNVSRTSSWALNDHWSPAANRQPRFRGEGLVEHCWKSDEIISNIRFHPLVLICVRIKLYDLNDIIAKYQLRINKHIDCIFWWIFVRKRDFRCFSICFMQTAHFMFFSISRARTLPNQTNTNVLIYIYIYVMLLQQSENVWATMAAMGKTSYFRFRFCDHLSYLTWDFLFAQRIARHFTFTVTWTRHQRIREKYGELIWIL